MSEVIDVEATEEPQGEIRQVVINVNPDNSMSYETNLGQAELIFWLEMVRSLVVKKILEDEG